jgi:hypothetical protein
MRRYRTWVVDNEAKTNRTVKIFYSVKAAEKWIEEQRTVDPAKVMRGGYGIDTNDPKYTGGK